jgi:hypothetical protein
MVFVMAGCGGTLPCSDPEPYERSRPGKRVEAPEGLDPLNPNREMTIPEPSPRPPSAANAACLDYPPSFRIGEPEPEVEEEAADEAEAENT